MRARDPARLEHIPKAPCLGATRWGLLAASKAYRVPGSGEEVVGAAAEAETGAKVDLHVGGQEIEDSPVHVVRRAIVRCVREHQHIPLVEEGRPLVHGIEPEEGLVKALKAVGRSPLAQVGRRIPRYPVLPPSVSLSVTPQPYIRLMYGSTV